MTLIVLVLLAACVGLMVRCIHDRNEFGATVSALLAIVLTVILFFRLNGGI